MLLILKQKIITSCLAAKRLHTYIFFSKKLFLTLNHDFLCEIVLFTSSDIFPYNFRYVQLVRIWENPLGGYFFFKHHVRLFSLIYNESAPLSSKPVGCGKANFEFR